MVRVDSLVGFSIRVVVSFFMVLRNISMKLVLMVGEMIGRVICRKVIKGVWLRVWVVFFNCGEVFFRVMWIGVWVSGMNSRV